MVYVVNREPLTETGIHATTRIGSIPQVGIALRVDHATEAPLTPMEHMSGLRGAGKVQSSPYCIYSSSGHL